MVRSAFVAALRAVHLIAAVAAFAIAIGSAQAADGAAEPLVSPAWLKSHLTDSNLVVLDIRSAIDGGGAEAYAQGHIAGAVHSDYDKSGWRVMRNNVPFMLPTVPELEKLIGELGIDEESSIVVVPAGVSYTDFGSAARVYWTLKTVGITNVSILDGGFAAWKAANYDIERGVRRPSPKIFTANFSKSGLAQGNEIEAIQHDGGATLIDARPASFFLGKEKAPTVAAYGHIPGAVNLDSATFYDPAVNRLRPKAELAAIAAELPSGPAVAYCNTGHWAATDWFVLHELLGRKDVRLYDGSMGEWTAKVDRPVASSRTKWDDLKKALGIGS